MKTSTLQKFINKYFLADDMSSVKWVAKDGVVEVSFSSSNKNVVGFISSKEIALENGEYNILDTEQLLSLISVLPPTDIEISNKKENGIVSNLLFKADKIKVTYVLADSRVIAKTATIKNSPIFDVVGNLDLEFRMAFSRAKSALKHESTFVVKYTGGSSGKLILGHSDHINTNNVHLDLPIDVDKTTGPLTSTLNFSAEYLNSIFSANKDCSLGTIQISNQRICKITFDTQEYNAVYYLSAITTT